MPVTALDDSDMEDMEAVLTENGYLNPTFNSSNSLNNIYNRSNNNFSSSSSNKIVKTTTQKKMGRPHPPVEKQVLQASLQLFGPDPNQTLFGERVTNIKITSYFPIG